MSDRLVVPAWRSDLDTSGDLLSDFPVILYGLQMELFYAITGNMSFLIMSFISQSISSSRTDGIKKLS